MPDLSKQFRTKERRKVLPATYKLRDGARWIVSDEAIEKIKQMRKEESEKKIASIGYRRGNSRLSS